MKRRSSKRSCQQKSVSYHGLEQRRMLAVTANLVGSELVIGGDGLDNTVMVRQSGSDLQVNVANQSGFTFDFASVSSLRFVGRAGDDVFTNETDLNTIASGNGGNDRITSGGGNDRLFGNDGDDVIASSGGANLLNGFSGNDLILGGSGADRIFGFDGNDIVNAGDGADFVVGGNGDDTVNAGSGNDTVFGNSGDDSIHGNAGNDFLYGQAGFDEVWGDVGNDVIRGGTDNDTLHGGLGNDRFDGEGGNDVVNGNEGRDVIFGGSGNDFLFGNEGEDFLLGGFGNDTIRGGAQSDQIRGNEGNDNLYGDSGNDRVAGDVGDDFLDGGVGFDTVLGDDGVDEIQGDSNDFVRGGAGDDFINLSSGNGDTAAFLGNYSDFLVTQAGELLYVRDTAGNEGLDSITGADSIRFADQARDAAADVNKRILVQPIIVSNNNGSNTAEFLGTAEEEATIKRLIDEIYLQANVDIEWVAPRTWNNSFANVGTSSTRPTSDLNIILEDGDDAGVGNSNPLIIDAYFVEVAAGFSNQSENVVNGLAFVGANGTTVHVGENLPTFENGREVVASVVAHELGHNFGLSHINDVNNLLYSGPEQRVGDEINAAQRNIIQNSQFSENV
jgi:Ca2+-binding RTX toxin-like protein